MKGTKLLLSFWLSTATFCLLQILIGPGGITETSRLREYRARLETRLEILQDQNTRLTTRYEALRSSPDEIRLEARSLGYFQTGEVPIRTLDGAGFRLPPDEPDLSTVPPLDESRLVPPLFFRLAWPLLFGVYYALFFLAGRLWPSLDRWEPPSPTPRPGLPVPWESGLDFFRK